MILGYLFSEMHGKLLCKFGSCLSDDDCFFNASTRPHYVIINYTVLPCWTIQLTISYRKLTKFSTIVPAVRIEGIHLTILILKCTGRN